MDLSLTTEQEELRATARRFLREEVTPEAIARSDTQLDRGLWAAIADMGWLAMVVPAEAGGLGASSTDVAVLFEELGRGPAPGPLLESGVLVPHVLEAISSADSFAGLAGLAGLAASLASGEEIATLILPDRPGFPTPPGTVDITLRATGRRASLSGRARFVAAARDATHVLVLAPSEAAGGPVACVYVPTSQPGVVIRRHTGFASRHCVVELHDVQVDVSRLVELPVEAEARVADAVTRSTPALSAFQVGSCEAVYEMTLAYSRERVQFGRPIGTYQRVQDHVIEIANAMDGARWATYYAASRMDLDPAALPREAIHVAKSATSEGHVTGCNGAHEVHAGIGADLKYGLAVHTYCSRSMYSYLGDPAWHRARLASLLGLRSNGRERAS